MRSLTFDYSRLGILFSTVDFICTYLQDINIIMSQEKRIKSAPIHEILPQEILVKILKKLEFKSVILAGRVCKYWNRIIVGFELIEAASSK